jgi:type I restriction enzyme S subunit
MMSDRNGNGQNGNSLPDGWEWSTLNDVSAINYRDPQLRNLPDDLPVNFVPMAAVDAQMGAIANPEVRPLKEVRKGFTPFSDGDVILAKITPSMENGKAAIARNLLNGRAFGSTEFHVLKPKGNVLAEFLFYFIRQVSFRQDAKAHFAGTAGQLRVPASFLFDYPIPLPPLSEQERIVSRIEELFSDLEAGVAALERVRAGLKRYKASVLKDACEGRLVRQNSDDELANQEVEYDEEGIGDLPQSWVWVKIDPILDDSRDGMKTGPFGSLLKKHEHREEGIPVVGIDNIRNMEFIPGSKIHITRAKAAELEKYDLRPGDVVISRSGTVGEVAVIPDSIGVARMSTNIMRISLRRDLMLPKFFTYLFNGSPAILDQVEDLCKGSTRDFLNQRILKSMLFPLPPLDEQRRIVTEIERRLSVVGEVESAIDAGLVRAGRLRQAVLKHAFEGRL